MTQNVCDRCDARDCCVDYYVAVRDNQQIAECADFVHCEDCTSDCDNCWWNCDPDDEDLICVSCEI